MTKAIVTLFVACFMIAACNSTKKTSKANDPSKLDGTWELNYISGQQIDFDSLYPNKKPTIKFDISNNRVNGNSSCNNYNGSLKVEGNQINIPEPMAMTRMACIDGKGEKILMEVLHQVNSFSISNDGKTLNLIMGDIALMRFSKK